MEDVLKEGGKYVLSILLLVVGVVFLKIYLGSAGLEKQPKEMLIAALFIIVAGILALPQVYGRMSNMFKAILLIFVFCCSAYLGYSVYNSIDSEIKLQQAERKYNSELIQKFQDLRDAEVAYRKVKGKYTANVQDQLIPFVTQKAIPIALNWGVFHDSIKGGMEKYREMGYLLKRNQLDSVAKLLGTTKDNLIKDINNDRTPYKVRDTLYVSFWDEHFAPEIRKDKELPLVKLEELDKNPNGKPFIIKTGVIESGGTKVPTIEVKDPTPFDRHDGVRLDTLKFGDLNANHTDGNWISEE